MAKDKSELGDKAEKKAKKEKKEKEKHVEKNGVSKHKKEKKLKQTDSAVPSVVPATDEAGDVEMSGIPEDKPQAAPRPVEEKPQLTPRPVGALVPFANPLADEKACKKVLRSVKKGSKIKALKRGVKEVVKALRKSAPATPASLVPSTLPHGVVILAADISPMDVISHIPVLCEDHGVPYIYVPSRAELGAAGSTKRPTSVVLVGQERGKDRRMEKAKEEREKGEKGENGDAIKEEEEDWDSVYGDLVKVVRKAGKHVKI